MAKLNPMISDGCKTASHSILEILVFFPAVLFVQSYVLSTALWLVCIQGVVLYMLGYAGGLMRLLRRRIYELVFALSASVLTAYLFQGWNLYGWAAGGLGLFLVLRGILFTKQSLVKVFPPSAYVAGLMLYFASVPFMNISDRLHPYLTFINVLGFALLIIFFYRVNRQQLLGATLMDSSKAKSSLTGSMRGMNRLMVTVLLIIISLIGFGRQLKDAAQSLLKSFFMYLSRSAPNRPIPQPSPPASAPKSTLPPLGEGHASWLALLLEKVFFVIGYAVVLFLLYLAATRILPAIVRTVRRLLRESGSGKKTPDPSGYTDEEESLVAWKELPGLLRKGLLNRFSRKKNSGPGWSQLTSNKDRVRFIYRALISHAVENGYAYNRANTPLETERDVKKQIRVTAASISDYALADLYNLARYGEEEPKHEEVDKALKAVEPILGKRFK